MSATERPALSNQEFGHLVFKEKFNRFLRTASPTEVENLTHSFAEAVKASRASLSGPADYQTLLIELTHEIASKRC